MERYYFNIWATVLNGGLDLIDDLFPKDFLRPSEDYHSLVRFLEYLRKERYNELEALVEDWKKAKKTGNY